MNPAAFVDQKFNFDVGNISFSPNYLQAAAVVGLVFLLVVAVAFARQKFVSWSIKGSLMGIFFGFLLALILEGFLIIGGRTAVTEILGWKNAPKPVTAALDKGKEKLVNVLGVSDEIPQSRASEDPSVEETIEMLQSLDPEEIQRVKVLICEP